MAKILLSLALCLSSVSAFSIGGVSSSLLRPKKSLQSDGANVGKGLPRGWVLQPHQIRDVRTQQLSVAIPASSFPPQNDTSSQVASMINGGATVEPRSRSPIKVYMSLLARRPILTKIVTSGVICGLGDIVAQALMFGGIGAKFFGALDIRRLITYAMMGALYLAPIVHYWFDAIDRIGPMNKTLPARTRKAGKMVALDQLIGAPIVNGGFIFLFSYLTMLTTGGFKVNPGKESYSKLVASIWPTLQGCWRIWPLANFINFMVVPVHLRVLFMNFIGLGWNIFLSSAVN